LMGSIYSNARDVLVWLGAFRVESSFSPDRLQLLPEIETGIEDPRTEHRFSNQLRAVSEFDSFLSQVSNRPKTVGDIRRWLRLALTFMTFLVVSNAGYFQRSWVVQELILAGSLRFFVGSRELSLQEIQCLIAWLGHFMQIFGSLGNMLGFGFEFRGLTHILEARKDQRNVPRSWSMEDYMTLVRDRQATKSEDKVNSILGLVGSHDQKQLQSPTDDEEPVEDVYVRFTVALASRSSWAHVLSLVGKVDDGIFELPSWIPDYSVPLRPKPFWYYGCSSFAAATAIHAQSNFLVVPLPTRSSKGTSHGLRISTAKIDVIEQIGEGANFRPVLASWGKGHLLDLVNNIGTTYLPTKEQAISVLLTTLTAGLFLDEDDLKDLNNDLVGLLESMFFPSFSPELRLIRSVQTIIMKHLRGDDEDEAFNETKLDSRAVARKFAELHHCTEFPFCDRLGYRALINIEANPGVSVQNHIPTPTGPSSDENSTQTAIQPVPSRAPPSRFMLAFESTYKDRRLFRTTGGYMGITSKNVRPGDIVMLVAGTDTPYVFRHVPGHPEHLKLIGNTFIHGMMQGEVLKLGTLNFIWKTII
jgi:hypothetical protein